jgi:hypothetical protein
LRKRGGLPSSDPAGLPRDGGLQQKVASEVAGVGGQKEVGEERDADHDEEAAWRFADLGNEQGRECDEQKGCVEQEGCELGKDMEGGEGAGEEVFGNGVGLALEPLHAGEDEDDGSEIECGCGEDDSAMGAKEPECGWEHDEDAEPCDLAGGAAEDIRDDGETEPGNATAVGRGLQCAQTAVETQDDGEEAVDVGHISSRKHEIEWRENEG